jgi:exodeoxyribonuclease VII large subunit
VDVVIVGRGGGGKEDLHVFNNERVARALAACRVPTVSAIGHEIDTTVCDLVADRRAATPSAAAEAAVPFMASEDVRVRELANRIVRVVRRRLHHDSQQLGRARAMTHSAAMRVTQRRRSQLSSVAARIQALSPLAVLARGFAIPRRPDGHTLTAAADFQAGDAFELIVRDGIVGAVTSTVRPQGWPVDLVETVVDESSEERP